METDGVTVRDKFNGKRVYHNFTAEHAILNRAPSPLSRKDLPLAVGMMVMSTEEIVAAQKGFAIEHTHYLDDALWNLSELD